MIEHAYLRDPPRAPQAHEQKHTVSRLMRKPRQHQIVLGATLLLASLSTSAHCSEPAAVLAVSESFQKLVTTLVREAIPHNYQNEKKWGKTKEVVRGLYIKREGLRLKTHRTRKLVNHGTWTRYRIDLLDPIQQFQVRLENVRMLPNDRMAFDIICDVKVHTFGRLAQWQQGVQLVSLSADADADLRLTLQCDLAARINTSQAIPDLELDPVVRNAELYVKEFRLNRISQLHGPLVKKLSASVREVLEDEIAKRRPKLVVKINRQIDKNRDHLRLSISELLSASGKGQEVQE